MTIPKGKILITKLNNKLLSLLIRDNHILSVQVQRSDDHMVGNIYVGRVQNISENIGAAFIDLGGGCLTFLPLSEAKHAFIVNRKADGPIKAGDEVLVQITKEPMKTKLAGVTTALSLAGRYVVVGWRGTQPSGMIQVSSKLSRKHQVSFRSMEALQEIAANYQLIVRTNAAQLDSFEPLVAEAQALAAQLAHLIDIGDKRTCYSCLHREKPEYLSFIENAYTSEYDEIITDLPEIYQELKVNIPLRLYEDSILPLYKLYSLETRIQELLNRKVWMKSGAYLVIEPTEALISIDVNSGKCEHGRNVEETFLRINMEAAETIAMHLRARNLSGMILVDFINLHKKEHVQQLMEYMKNLLKKDNVPADVIDMTGLGLMEITRKKVNPSFYEQYKAE